MTRFGRRSASKGNEFFDLFEAASGNIVRAAELLDRMMGSYPDEAELAREILICEQDGDRITHDIIRRLNQAAATPIEREDVHQLASGLDDIVDWIEETADFLGLYRIEAPMEQAQELCKVLKKAATHLHQAMRLMRDFGDIHQHTTEIDNLEHEGDRISREGLASLFESGVDPMVVIRWKDIYERIESAIDATESVSHMLESILIKHGL